MQTKRKYKLIQTQGLNPSTHKGVGPFGKKNDH